MSGSGPSWQLPPPHVWRSGPWSLELRDDEFADIGYDGRPVLRAVRAVVRDRDWSTASLVVDGIDETDAALTLAVHSDGFGSSLSGAVSVTVAGDELTVSCDLVSAAAFATNRTGLVVLHPPVVAGAGLDVTHAGGTAERTAFPQAISPHQPVLDIAGLAWEHDGLEVDVSFEGDVFEMEDQRNWTDASFKTYSRPLALPFPYDVAAGEHVRQSVRVRASAQSVRWADASPDVIVLRRAGSFPAIGVGASTAPDPAPPVVECPPEAGLSIPGEPDEHSGSRYAASGGYSTTGKTEPALLVELDIAAPNWRAALARAASTGIPLAVRIVLPDDGRDFAPLSADALAGLAAAAEALRSIRLARVSAHTRMLHTTTAATVAALRNALRAAGVDAPVIGGVRSHFTEYNREHHLVPADVDGIGFSSTPLFHSIGTEQLVESVAMQRLTALQAVELARGLPVHVEPITLRPRFNDVATGSQPAPTRDDLSEGYGAEFTGAVDERLFAPEAAAWTIASAAAFAVPGVATLTYFEEWGPRGIRSSTGEPRPVAAAIDALRSLGGHLLWGESPDGLVWALGAQRDGATTVLAANLDRRERTITVTGAADAGFVVPALSWAASSL